MWRAGENQRGPIPFQPAVLVLPVIEEEPCSRSVVVMKRPTPVRQLLEALRSYQPQRVYLFGSYARGEADELSDLDVVVIKHTAQPFLERLREISKLLPASIGGVDVFVYTPEEFATMLANGNAFAEMVAEEGRLIYEQQAEG